jgi:hypothetical protein
MTVSSSAVQRRISDESGISNRKVFGGNQRWTQRGAAMAFCCLCHVPSLAHTNSCQNLCEFQSGLQPVHFTAHTNSWENLREVQSGLQCVPHRAEKSTHSNRFVVSELRDLADGTLIGKKKSENRCAVRHTGTVRQSQLTLCYSNKCITCWQVMAVYNPPTDYTTSASPKTSVSSEHICSQLRHRFEAVNPSLESKINSMICTAVWRRDMGSNSWNSL